MSTAPLNDRTKVELLALAKRRGIPNYEGMRKEELIKALSTPPKPSKPAAPPAKVPAKVATKPVTNGTVKHATGTAKSSAPTKVSTPSKAAVPASKGPVKLPEPIRPSKPVQVSARVESAISADKDLSAKSTKSGVVKDRLVLTAPDPFWLHAFWELSTQSVQRAEAALGQDWHGAKPILRIFDVTSADTTSTSEAPLRDIVIHGGCNHWYVDVPQPPRSYRADIGYVSRRGNFFILVRSNVISPPKAGASEAVEGNPNGDIRPERPAGTDPSHAGREHFDDHFRRPLKEAAFGPGAVLPGKLKKFFFDIDAELIVYGKTDPTAAVTLQNEPVKLRPDGTFTMRFSLPDSRQIIPAVATSSDGMEEQTIVLAVERNTKRLDPMMHDLYADT